MRRSFLLIAISAMAVIGATASRAQTYTFTPAVPQAGQSVTINASWHFGGNFVMTKSATVVGNSVTVIFVQDGPNFSPNPQIIDSSVSTPPLEAGVYTFTITWVPEPGYTAPVTPQVFVIAVSGPPVAVEYYYEAWNYYFETSLPDEIAALDGGAFGGVWKRTGETFNVWPQSDTNLSPVCRFFTTAFAPKSSHVYTPFASECESLKQGSTWQYEGIAFYVQLASAEGLCDNGTIPLYRLYNNGMGGAPNHRYTTSMAALDQMVAAGWVFEGNGNTKVFACVPQ